MVADDRIGAAQLGPSALSVEHPLDAGLGRVALSLPGVDLGDKPLAFADASVQALAAQHADLDIDHVEPAGVLGRSGTPAAGECDGPPPAEKPRTARRMCGSRGCPAPPGS